MIKLSDLIEHERNDNEHKKEHAEALAKFMLKKGIRHPIIVSNLSGKIAAGHLRKWAATINGMTEYPVDYQDFIDEQDEYEFLSGDNNLSRYAEFNEDKMLVNLKELDFDLDSFCFDDIGLIDFELPLPEVIGECDEDEVPEVKNGCPTTERGDIWLLGEHRLMCGDSTNISLVDRLMNSEKAKLLFTSPPYSDMRDYNGEKNLSVDNLIEFITAYAHVSEYQVINLGLQRKNNEVHDYWTPYINKAKDNGYLFLSWNIWDKGESGSIGNQTAMFPIEHEWIFVFGKERGNLNKTIDCKYVKTKSTSNSIRNKDGSTSKNKDWIIGDKKPMSTVYKKGALKARNLDNSHPAAFTVDFAHGYIEAMTNISENIIDPFCGSGSTLIACEKTNRKCYGMELDEHYCDVIIQRWQKFTGKHAVLEDTGETYNELLTLKEDSLPRSC